jgi:CRP-like cAMP-binding protein
MAMRSEMTRHETRHSLPAGRPLFEEGEEPSGVYVLHSGEVALSSVIEGRNTRMRTAHPGEILGLMAVVSDRTHLSSAVATSPCEVSFINADEFRTLIDKDPSVWFSVLRQLSWDVNASYDVMRGRA